MPNKCNREPAPGRSVDLLVGGGCHDSDTDPDDHEHDEDEGGDGMAEGTHCGHATATRSGLRVPSEGRRPRHRENIRFFRHAGKGEIGHRGGGLLV